jgi:hypothetical protein
MQLLRRADEVELEHKRLLENVALAEASPVTVCSDADGVMTKEMDEGGDVHDALEATPSVNRLTVHEPPLLVFVGASAAVASAALKRASSVSPDDSPDSLLARKSKDMKARMRSRMTETIVMRRMSENLNPEELKLFSERRPSQRRPSQTKHGSFLKVETGNSLLPMVPLMSDDPVGERICTPPSDDEELTVFDTSIANIMTSCKQERRLSELSPSPSGRQSRAVTPRQSAPASIVGLDFHSVVEKSLEKSRNAMDLIDVEVGLETVRERAEMKNICQKHGLLESVVETIRKRYKSLDTDGDGRLDEGEFTAWLTKLMSFNGGVYHKTASRWHQDLHSLSKDGQVSFEEFLRWLMSKWPEIGEMTNREVDQFLDGDLNALKKRTSKNSHQVR